LEYGALVSVVMPVFNRAHLVRRVVGSILAQTYRNLDIVIVDDCSTDDIEGAIAALGDPRVRLIRRERNGGASASRNTGVAAARADWIAFHDSDDYCTSDRIELSVRKMMELPQDYIGVYGMAFFYTEVSEADYRLKETFFLPRASEPLLSGDMAARTRQGNMMNLPTIMVRKSALQSAGPFDERLRQNVDWDLCLRLTQQGKFGFVPEVLILSSNPLDPLIQAKKISRSALQGARSFVRITGKLRREGMTGPYLAAHYASAGRNLMRVDRPILARHFLRASLAEDPWKPRIWAHYLLSYAPGLHARLRKVNRHGFTGG
jgi:glycosyltransferase involved in cell wall biosynthesis